MDLLLVRHGLPERVEGADGPADPVLTDEGRRQSEQLADWLAHEHLDHLMSSTLRRARQTAAPVAERLGLDVEPVQGLSEFDADADSYIPIEELRQARDPRFLAIVEGRWDELGSSVDPTAFADLVHTTIEGVIERFAGHRVAIVCHGGVINLYLGRILGVDRPLWFEPGYTSISRVAASRAGHRTIVTLNETAHLIATRAR
ncbi:MAG TPA: histidine phosphatase family protein [Acidimicrobiales bacterium]|jgi:probable phosphoglycerate mutase|nr:histidine phosphatase family protein [Acidimicrobiales bacterium]